jgi:hypothetical protein
MRRPTYSEVASTLALFIALGGTSYAVTSLPADSVGSAQLKSGSVTASKLHAHAVGAAAVAKNSLTGAQIDESSLGLVPHAALADTATSAKTAKSADTATSASTAVMATTAANANALGGAAPSSYKVSCPDDMVQTKDLCVELAERPADTWTDAEQICSSASRRLPSVGELGEAMDALAASQDPEWSSDVSIDTSSVAAELGDNASRQDLVEFGSTTLAVPYRCVSTPVNTG